MNLEFVWPRLHDGGQYEVARDPARFKVVAAGRRWGKSKLGAMLCTRDAMRGGYAWWISPTYKMALMGWRELLRFAKLVPGVVVNRSERTLIYPAVNGHGQGYIQIRSASDPDSLRGEGLSFAFLDEFAFMERKVWTHSIRPALADRKGHAMFGSTPFGHNHFWELFERGMEEGNAFKSWRFPTVANPFIDPAEIADAQREMPEDAFRQEHLAEFLESEAGVFRNLGAIFSADLSLAPGIPSHWHVVGYDVAKLRDFAAWSVIDTKAHQLVHFERARGMSYPRQIEKTREIMREYPGVLWIDSTGAGEPVYDQLAALGAPVEPFQFTAPSKRKLVENGAIALDRERIRIPLCDETHVLHEEMKAYRYQLGRRGQIEYGAIPGEHDDAATSLLLALWGLTAPRSQVVLPLPEVAGAYFSSDATRRL